ncbi:MAG TPA: hypothetical protein VK741_22890 [Acetobacteraceae bacterium]|jgi:hypothetical protein|nr:hypothetical protein [Acetobacteraceae bacterium]
MSGALLGASVAAGVGQQALAATGLIPAWIRLPRSIGDASTPGGAIIPDVTIEEHFSDRATVTLHPLAKGSPASDHMFMLPRTVTMRCGWSNSNIVGGVVQAATGLISGGASLAATGSSVLGLFTEQRVNGIYQKLLALQAARQPFTLITGKRTYDGQGTNAQQVVITELSVANDHHTEYALILECHMQEVLIVDLGEADSPPQDAQAIPQTTQPPTDAGNQQPAPVLRSTLSNITGSQQQKATP